MASYHPAAATFPGQRAPSRRARGPAWKFTSGVSQARALPLTPTVTSARPAPRDTFALLLREHEPVLFALARRQCGSAQDAQDLVQDTFERALRNLHTLRPDANVRAWLVTLQHHLFIDRCRRLKRDGGAHVNAEEAEVEARFAVPAPEPEPAWASVTETQVQDALQTLNADFRAVYQLHALEGRSYQEIAEILKIAKATVGTRLIRARQKLKRLLMPPAVDDTEPGAGT